MSETVQHPTTASTSAVEVALRIWRSVLEPPPGSEGATFFELGGQSITAVLMVNLVQEELGVDIDIVDLFDDPDVRGFTTLVIRAAA